MLLAVFTAALQPVLAAEYPEDFDRVASGIFWQELYPYGGWTLYCGYRFGSDRLTEAGQAVVIDHILPVSVMMQHAGCSSRMECREQGNGTFRAMEADMHNMYPVTQALTTHLYNTSYGEIPGDQQRYDDCDIEWKAGIVEPRELARGNIARAMLYMQQRYGVHLDDRTIDLLKDWNRTDPPSDQETVRNNRIEELQGNRNPYIDDPAIAERVRLSNAP